MRREDPGDLMMFLAVARARSFTRAAARLGTSQSALSHVVRRLEARLGVRLLMRTTRSVAPTQAGERLIETLQPAFDDIDAELAALGRWREKPAGTIRITCPEGPATAILWPALAKLLPEWPDVTVELSVDPRLVDIVAERYDAGVRLGEQVANDMIGLRIRPDFRMAVVGAPSYLERASMPTAPQHLVRHRCINLRLPTLGGLYAWEFEQGRQKLNVRVEGQLVLNRTELILKAAAEGFGLACVPEERALPYLADGRLLRVLDDWCPTWPGYHLYYPSGRQPTPAFALLVEALRYRG